MADRLLEDFLVSSIGSAIGNDTLGTILLTVAIISLGMMYSIIRYSMIDTDIGPLTFVATRFILSAVILILYNVWRLCGCNVSLSSVIEEMNHWWGLFAGLTLTCITIALQYSESSQSASQTSLILGMYVVVIPLVELALSHFQMSLSWRTWLALAIDIPGLILVSGCTNSSCFSYINWGVLSNVLAMLCTAANTILYGRGVLAHGVMPMAISSFTICAVVSTVLALSLETDQWEYPYTEISTNWWLIIAGALLETLALICMLVALTFTSIIRTTIVTSVESLSGAFFGWLILGEMLTALEYVGGAMMFIAVLIELWPFDAEEEKPSQEMVQRTAPDEYTALLRRDI